MEEEIVSLEAIARKMRRTVLEMTYETNSPHIGSSFSSIEILVALFKSIMNIPSDNMNNPERDRFIMSKGHACPALYATLAEFGYFDPDDLRRFAVDGGIFERHPNIDLGRGIELSSGSLGHGLSVGAGMALAARIDDRSYKTYVLMSDGELDEGAVWEAIMFAGHHGMANLAAFIDANSIQALGPTKDIINLEPIGRKWSEFGWHAQEIDGHDFRQIQGAIAAFSEERPNVVVLNTVKGKGVSFMENNVLWHYRTPDDEEYRLALEELSE